jgi:hypothetical protein
MLRELHTHDGRAKDRHGVKAWGRRVLVADAQH